jgi:hypothetical protein
VRFQHYVVKPGAVAAAIAAILWLARRQALTIEIAAGVAFAVATICLNTRLGQRISETATDWYMRGWQYLWLELVPGLIRWVLEAFKRGVEGIERLLYTVDEWLRFRSGDSRLSLIVKPALGIVWFVITYAIRVLLNLFVEPTFNPIKHFPTVTVAAKMITPMLLLNHKHMVVAIAPLTGFWLGNAVVVLVEGLLPGLAGFLVWEFKENWKLYAANRSPVLRPLLIGHHGETMLRFLKPGFHSGTIPRLYAKMRRASRYAQKTGDWRAFRKYREGLHHVNETLHRFLEREFLILIEQSRCWQAPEVTVDLVRLSSNRIRLELGCAGLSDQDLVVTFEERSGWLMAGIAQSGWLAKLKNEQRRVLVNALTGLYKLAGVHLIHEQIRATFGPNVAYDATDNGLVIWPSDTFAARATYDLTLGPVLTPRITNGAFARELPTVPISPFVFAKAPVTWAQWVETWEKDLNGKGHPKSIVHGIHILPGDDKGTVG